MSLYKDRPFFQFPVTCSRFCLETSPELPLTFTFLACISKLLQPLPITQFQSCFYSFRYLLWEHPPFSYQNLSWPVEAAKMKYHGLGGFNNRNLFLTDLEAGSLRPVCHHDQSMVKTLVLACRQLPSHFILTCWKKKSSSLVSLHIRALLPSDQGITLIIPISSPRPHLQIAPH